jgi:hypothetical protein
VLGGMSMPRWRRCVRMQRRTGGLTTADECARGQDRQVRLRLHDERVAARHVGAPCELEAGECRERWIGGGEAHEARRGGTRAGG